MLGSAAHLPPVTLLVQCASPEEAAVAWEAIHSLRVGHQAAPTGNGSPIDPVLAHAARLEKALRGAPMNRTKEIVLTMLQAGAHDAWVAYPDMQAAFVSEGLKPERAAAAIRDLSWAMSEFLPPHDTAGFARKIEVLAERSRSGGVFRYRLTKAGRIAVTNFLMPVQP